ncbi:four helix bundle protein [Lunatimonas salinarum]|uniref:four helix bundle protein n=1 Tax=Lunatimonas salinarum TaxID=1774590 RepID=UPI001ADFB331|nr:four helix bundle protein [Lunatimonas salinarum]
MLPPFHTYSFEKLEVWILAKELRVDIYKLTQSFPREEQYNLTSQLRRAIGSVTANLVEGSGRASDKDRARFTNNAYSSALEVLDHLIAAFDLGFIEQSDYTTFRLKLDKLINKLNAYYKYQVNRDGDLRTRRD